MFAEGDETEKERLEQRINKAKKRAISSSIMADLREELDKDRPTEIRVRLCSINCYFHARLF